MTRRGVAVLVAVALVAGGAYGWRAWDNSRFFRPAGLFSRFPIEDATALSVDFAALRKAGLLDESKTPPEPEYKAFLDGSGFDYRRDLDFLAASFSKSGNYFIARGRFDWNKLRGYALSQGGSCYRQLCRMQGSRPDRHISFLPLRADAIALAVGSDDLAASRLTKEGLPVSTRLPDAPVWLSVPGAVLRSQDGVPPGIRMMLSALKNADRVMLTVNAVSGGVEARLETSCRTQDDARALTSELRSTTALLKDTDPNDQAIRDDDLVKTLSAGVFEQAGPRVTGRWPLSKNLIASLTSGI
jgi:hypothetical protein